MTVYAFIAEEQANNSWTVREMCRVLDVSKSGYYDWHGRGPWIQPPRRRHRRITTPSVEPGQP